MRIQVASDLHLEFLARALPRERLVVPARGAKVLLLAGDIGSGTAGLEAFADWPVPVVYVPGNHEFYQHDIGETRGRMRETAARLGVHLLDDQAVELGGVRFVGATMWTDFALYGKPEHGMFTASQYMNDFRLIRTGRTTFRPEDSVGLHQASRTWLEGVLAQPFDGKTVVVTHHLPHRRSIAATFAGDSLNPAFASDLSELVAHTDLWVHGHTHASFDYRVGDCRVVANPAGYARNYTSAMSAEDLALENPAFRKNLTVVV